MCETPIDKAYFNHKKVQQEDQEIITQLEVP